MKQFKDTIEDLRGHSLAMYSTWIYHKSTHVLFDAGEGVCTAMRNHIFGVENIFLSHGHYDHIGGLIGMIYSRASARGDKTKPLTIYYPSGWNTIYGLMRYVDESIGNIKYELKWIPIKPGEVIQVGKKTFVRPFKVQHVSGSLCLGYEMFETRKRLKLGLVHKSQQEIAEISKAQGKDAVKESYEKIVLAYCGDSWGVDPNRVRDADVLIHEATFLEVEDRTKDTHSSAHEALSVAKDANVGSLILIHISGRYRRDEVVEKIKAAARDTYWTKPLAVMLGSRIVEVQ